MRIRKFVNGRWHEFEPLHANVESVCIEENGRRVYVFNTTRNGRLGANVFDHDGVAQVSAFNDTYSGGGEDE